MIYAPKKKTAVAFIFTVLMLVSVFCPAQEIDLYKDSVDLPALAEIEAVELLIAAPSLKSPASIAGHLFLLLRRKNDISGLSVVIGFVANSGEDENAGINPLLYSLRGLFGYYRSMVQRERLVTVINRNTIIEDRNVLRLQLKMNRLQKERLLAGLKEMERILPDKRYYFLNRNCTSLLLSLLREVYRGGPRPVDIELIDMPLQVAAKFFRAGLAEFAYPDYPGISQAAGNAWQEVDRLLTLKEKMPSEKNTWRNYFRQQMVYFQKRFSEIDREKFYQKLFKSFLETSMEIPETGQETDLLERGSLLLSFFQAAAAIERFQEYGKKSSSGEKKELLDFVSSQITKLLDLTLKLRARLLREGEEFQEDSWFNGTNRSSKTVRNKQDQSPFMPGYSVLSLAPGLVSRKVSLHLEYSLLRQQMGDQSLFAANRNSRLELFKLSGHFFSGDSSFRQTTLLQYAKVVNNPGTAGKSFIRPGFSFVFFSRKSGLYPELLSHTDSMKTCFLLNLFEKNVFRHYLQARAGFSLASIKMLEAGKFNSFGLTAGMEGKIQLDSRNRLELRAAWEYNKYSGRSGFSAETIETEVEINCIPWRRAGVQFFSGWRAQKGVYQPHAAGIIEYNYKYLLFGLRFGLDSLFGLFGRN